MIDSIKEGLIGYTDADYGNDEKTRRSVTGNIIYLHGSAIICRASLQPIVTLRTCEAEFVAMAACATNIMFIRQLGADLKFKPITDYNVIMYCDNKTAKTLTENNTASKITKHIDIRFFWIRGNVETQEIICCWIPTYLNKANIFTKKMNNP